MRVSTAYRLLMAANRTYLKRTYGRDFYRRFRLESDGKLAELSPKIPDIGKSVFSLSYAFIVAYVPFFHGFQQCEETAEKAGELVWTMNENLFERIPGPLLKLMGKSALSGKMSKRFKDAQTAGEQGRLHPMDWRLEVVEQPGAALCYNIKACGALSLLREIGEAGVFPYACRIDYLMANRTGVVFTRTKTLAEGADCCNMQMSGLGLTKWAPETGFEFRK